jgi:hybrid cluster-associated redox disulfide protein
MGRQFVGRYDRPGVSSRVSAHFNKDMTVENAFRTHAGARRVFAKFHLGGCANCAISETETIEQVSEGYGIPLPMLMEELETLFAAGTLEVGDKVRLPDEIRAKIPQLADVPETGEVKSADAGAYTVEFGDVRLQGLSEDFIKVVEVAAGA